MDGACFAHGVDAVWPGLRAAMLVCLALIALPVPVAADPVFPALTGRVVDAADVLSPSDEAEITATLASIEAASTDQVVVVTLPSLQGYDIADYGYRLGRHWGIGQKGKDNGVLLIVAPSERLVRIEVGRKLEPIITDGLASGIIQNRILPAFRSGSYPAGIKAGVTDIKDALLGDVEEVKQRAAGGSADANQVDYAAIIFMAIWITLFIYMMYRAHQQAKAAQSDPSLQQARRSGPRVIIVPGGWGGSGGWSGGSSGGGWSGGGGGGFGGGGASGGW